MLYAFAASTREMASYTSDRVLHRLRPLRPERQSCIICRTAPLALNLAADFLVAIVHLDFDETDSSIPKVGELFPSEGEDSFLSAIKENILRPDLLLNPIH